MTIVMTSGRSQVAPGGFLVVGSVGYSLVIGALTLIWKRVEMLNDPLLVIVFLTGGMMIDLNDMPGWMAVAVGRTDSGESQP